MREYGLIGHPLGHSFSKTYFTEKFKKLGLKNCKYQLHPISEVSKIINVVKNHKNTVGLNVTTPYKELVIPYLNELDDTALKSGVVNTIKVLRHNNNYFLKGFNTDIYGFNELLKSIKIPKKSKAIILGSGGSAKTVAYVFSTLNINYTHVSRTPTKAGTVSYKDLPGIINDTYNIIVNATPVGMSPNNSAYPPIPYDSINNSFYCIDLIYNPETTEFLKKSESKGAKTQNGMIMLKAQAEKAWEIWNDN